MSDRACRIVVLCEDRQHETFLYRLLKDLGFPKGRIETKTCSTGAADQFVRERYADEVEMHRRQAKKMKIGLVVMIDADENTVDERHQELNNVLAERGLDSRSQDEAVCLLVPKRNIETWIYALLGEDVNETEAYSKLERQRQCQPAVDQLAADVRDGCRDDVIPSLYRGCRELHARLPE